MVEFKKLILIFRQLKFIASERNQFFHPSIKASATRLPVDTQWTDLLIDYIYYLSRVMHVHVPVDGYKPTRRD